MNATNFTQPRLFAALMLVGYGIFPNHVNFMANLRRPKNAKDIMVKKDIFEACVHEL